MNPLKHTLQCFICCYGDSDMQITPCMLCLSASQTKVGVFFKFFIELNPIWPPTAESNLIMNEMQLLSEGVKAG